MPSNSSSVRSSRSCGFYTVRPVALHSGHRPFLTFPTTSAVFPLTSGSRAVALEVSRAIPRGPESRIQVISEANASNWLNAYVRMNGMPVAQYTVGQPRTAFVHADHLGSTRLLTSVGSNLVSNPGFESGLTGCNNTTNVTLVTDAARAHSGSDYVQISVPASGAANVFSQAIAVQPGDQISYGGWAYMESGPGTSGNTGWWLETQDSSHTALAWYPASPAPSTSSGWTFQSGSYTIPSGVSYVALYGLLYLPTVATTLRVDDGFLYDNRSGLQIVQNLDYLPFGELNSADSGTTSHKFTGDEHDSESNLDHTLFRQYSSSLARWTTPDPAGLASVDPSDPQSWNRFAYVRNDPLDLVDPDGLDYDYCMGLGQNQICGTAPNWSDLLMVVYGVQGRYLVGSMTEGSIFLLDGENAPALSGILCIFRATKSQRPAYPRPKQDRQL